MEKYENLAVVGEGSYGLVMKCRHRETGQVVAIKKFIETEEDLSVRKMALREIRMLKKLRHENLVNMIEVFRRKRRFYLVFEYMDHTVLDELEEHQQGLGEEVTRAHIFQVLRGIDFCHANHIVHRDVKPENVLVSPQGVIKLCDFGFARLVAASPNETYTDYVATRWYRAPELLVGDTKYGKEVDIWAVGCLFAEMMSGDPLFPGESDIDQLFQICKLLGRLSPRHLQLAARNPRLRGLRRSAEDGGRALSRLHAQWPSLSTAFCAACLRLDPHARPSAADLLQHAYFTCDRFPDRFMPTLRFKVQQELQSNPLLRKHLSVVTAAPTPAASRRQSTRVHPQLPAPPPPPTHHHDVTHAVAAAAAAAAREAVAARGAARMAREAGQPRWRLELMGGDRSDRSGGDADCARGRIASQPPPASDAAASLNGHDAIEESQMTSLGEGLHGGMGMGLGLGAAVAATTVRRKLSDSAVDMMEGGGGGTTGRSGAASPGAGYASLPPQLPMQHTQQLVQAAGGDAPGALAAQQAYHAQHVQHAQQQHQVQQAQHAQPQHAQAPSGGTGVTGGTSHNHPHPQHHLPAAPQLLHPAINNLYFTGRGFDHTPLFAAKKTAGAQCLEVAENELPSLSDPGKWRLLEPAKKSPLLLTHLREPLAVSPRPTGGLQVQARRLERPLLADTGQQTPPQAPQAVLGQTQQSPQTPQAPPSQAAGVTGERWLAPRRLAPAVAATMVTSGGHSHSHAHPHGHRGSVGKGGPGAPDDFSLPNVPGASSSPIKGGKKKLHPVSHNTLDPFISPDVSESSWQSESTASQPLKRKRTSVELPHLSK